MNNFSQSFLLLIKIICGVLSIEEIPESSWILNTKEHYLINKIHTVKC